MDLASASYLAAVSLAGGIARGLRRGLPAGWRLRLEAEAPEGLPEGRWIWLHAVSVGELLLAEGLLARLREAGHRVHLTTGTTAGAALLAQRLPRWDAGTGRITGGAFPVDDRAGLRPFLRRRPGAFVALETELWPNLLRSLRAAGVPAAIVNGRLTAKSLHRGGPWMRAAAGRLSLVAARDEASAAAFRSLGAPCVELGGNLKADLPPPPPLHTGWEALRRAWAADPVLVVGNTVDGEEAALLALWRELAQARPGLRLILAPRQPKRFGAVAEMMAAGGLAFRRASEPWPEDAVAWRGTGVLLLDTLGELPRAYGEGTVALVGGGWLARGGHNPLEPARFGMPVLIGPGHANFDDLVEPLRAAGAIQVAELEHLHDAVASTLDGTPLRPAWSPEAPPPAVAGLLGALERSWALLEPLLPSPPPGGLGSITPLEGPA